MGRKWSASDTGTRGDHAAGDDEPITLFAAWVGATDRGAAALRQALQLSVAVRTWHRVCPYLPRETRADGSLVLWHPQGADWSRAQERVHAGRRIAWRKSGAYVKLPGSESVVLHDFRDFDELDLADWSIAVPHTRFREMCLRARIDETRLSELLARWALEVGPREAGLALRRCPGS